MFPSGFVSPASNSCVIFCRVPARWVEGGSLKDGKLESVFEQLYGKTWRSGNDDGSRYVVLSAEAAVLTPAEEQAAPWRGLKNDRETSYWFYHVSEAEEFRQVKPADF